MGDVLGCTIKRRFFGSKKLFTQNNPEFAGKIEYYYNVFNPVGLKEVDSTEDIFLENEFSSKASLEDYIDAI